MSKKREVDVDVDIERTDQGKGERVQLKDPDDRSQAPVYPQSPDTLSDDAEVAPQGRYHGYTVEQAQRMEDARGEEQLPIPSEESAAIVPEPEMAEEDSRDHPKR